MTIDGSSRNQNTVEDQESVPDEGLPERFEQLFRNQNKALVHMLSERLRDPEAARDVAQEAYERIFKGDRAGTLTNLRVATLAYLRNYLFKTAHNIALDRLRARAVRARDAVSVAQHLDGGDAPSAEHVCIQAQEWERFKEAAQELPPRCREAFSLVEFECLPVPVIAERMGVRPTQLGNYTSAPASTC